MLAAVDSTFALHLERQNVGSRKSNDPFDSWDIRIPGGNARDGLLAFAGYRVACGTYILLGDSHFVWAQVTFRAASDSTIVDRPESWINERKNSEAHFDIHIGSDFDIGM